MSIRQQSSESNDGLLFSQQTAYLAVFFVVGFFEVCFLATGFFLVVVAGLRAAGLRPAGLRAALLVVASAPIPDVTLAREPIVVI
jgi:hypothetical protein